MSNYIGPGYQFNNRNQYPYNPAPVDYKNNLGMNMNPDFNLPQGLQEQQESPYKALIKTAGMLVAGFLTCFVIRKGTDKLIAGGTDSILAKTIDKVDKGSFATSNFSKNISKAFESAKNKIANIHKDFMKKSPFYKDVVAAVQSSTIQSELNPDKDLQALLDKTKKSSNLANFMTKSTLIAREFFDYRGLMALMNSYFIGSSIEKTVSAQKGEKISTLMENMTESVIYTALFRPISGIIDKLTGLKNVKGEGFGRFLARGAGNILGVGKNSENSMLNSLGSILRTFVFPLIFIKPISSLFTMISHKIFGKPTNMEEILKELMNKVASDPNFLQNNPNFPQNNTASESKYPSFPLQNSFLNQQYSPEINQILKDSKESETRALKALGYK